MTNTTSGPDASAPPPLNRVATSRFGMAATSHPGATDAAVEILSEGGNAVDAAVAAALALAVCEPMESGLGGQSLILLYEQASGRVIAIDGSTRAPRLADPRLPSEEIRRGHKAAAVPTTPAALEHARRRYGTLPMARLIEPAIRLAEDGYTITPLQHRLTEREAAMLIQHGGARFFLNERQVPWPVGSRLCQDVMAKTLRRLATAGIEDFYLGEIAGAMHDDMVRHGGWLRREDLQPIPWPRELSPLSRQVESWDVFTFPPPGGGATVLEMLSGWSALDQDLRDMDSPAGALAFANLAHAAARNYIIQASGPSSCSDTTDEDDKDEGGQTTHLSVVDRDGNAVALTQSLNRVFGSCAAAPNLGFVYNGYVRAFNRKKPDHPYFLRPGAVPRVCSAPTILFQNGRLFAAIGSPGSARIPQAIVQVLARLGSSDPWCAVTAPRIYVSSRKTAFLEARGIDCGIKNMLKQAKYEIRDLEPFSFFLGSVQMVVSREGELIGVADPRRDGTAGGPSKMA